jgi:SAM-dependent methyltransferase
LTSAMEGYTPSTYGDRAAADYDELYESMFDVEGAVDFIASVAGGGPALELGIGTGRIAIPLARRGVDVRGVDSSETMVARLRAKAPDVEIPVAMGDFGEVDLGGPFSAVFVVFNTFFALLTQDAQIDTFRRVEAALAPNGVFVIEAFVPDQTRWDRHQRVSVDRMSMDEVRLEISRHDPVGQRVDAQAVKISHEGIRFSPVSMRYAWPSELDVMARVAGLGLQERWANWRRDPFTSDSHTHISVYERFNP